MPNELALLDNFDKAKALIAAADLVGAVDWINKGEALRVYATKAKKGLEIQNQCAEIKLRAERRAGEILAENPDIRPGGDRKSSLHDERMKLSDFGISEIQSHRWQLEASVPVDIYERHVAETKARDLELTSLDIYRIAKEIIRNAGRTRNEQPILPEGKFDVIYADPPWQYEFSETESRSIEAHYPTLSLDEIKYYKDSQGTPVQNKFAEDAVLFLWATQPKLKEALEVIEAWGFIYRTGAVWVKDKIGMGYYFREQHELLLVGRKGNIEVPAPENRPSSVIAAPRLEHSAKPEEVYNQIEKMYPRGTYLEVFATKRREKWVSFGIEVAVA